MDAIFFALMFATIVWAVRRGAPDTATMTIGPSAKLAALRRMIGLCPRVRTVVVVDGRRIPIGVVPVARVRALPAEVLSSSILIVADVMTADRRRRATHVS